METPAQILTFEETNILGNILNYSFGKANQTIGNSPMGHKLARKYKEWDRKQSKTIQPCSHPLRNGSHRSQTWNRNQNG